MVQELYAEKSAQTTRAQADRKSISSGEAASNLIGVEHQEGNGSEGAIPDEGNNRKS